MPTTVTEDPSTSDKENQNTNSSQLACAPLAGSATPAAQPPEPTHPGSQSRQLFGKAGHKTGLHENLKSLSAQVRMMEEDKDALAAGGAETKRASADAAAPACKPSRSVEEGPNKVTIFKYITIEDAIRD